MTTAKDIKQNNLMADGMYEFVNNNFLAAIDILSRVLDDEPDNKTALLSRGSAYMKLEQLDEAAEDFNAVIKIDPESAQAFHLRGLVRERQGRDKEALMDIETAVNLDPEYGAAYYSRANLNAKLDRGDEAEEDMKMVAHLSELNLEAFGNEQNVWRTQHFRTEDAMETELER